MLHVWTPLPPLRFPTSTSRENVAPFIRTLSDMMCNTSPSILSWSRDGRNVVIHDHEVFLSSTLPFFFTSSNFASFQRQLNYHGFRRVFGQRQAGKCVYFNALFSRQAPQDMQRIFKYLGKTRAAAKIVKKENNL